MSDLEIEDIGRAALLLAMTKDLSSENAYRRHIEKHGWRAVATEIGGILNTLPQKMVKAMVGASLNAGIINKTSCEMHALVHAAIEASNVFLVRGVLEISIGAKIAIVRNDVWLAVAIFGDCSAHILAHHDRCGLGIMHI